MPWNKDDEGGGQGPWGQGPKDKPRNQNNWGGGGNRGPGSGGGLPPDLDELVRRGKDSLKNAIPGGGGRGSWLIPVALAAVFMVFNSIYQVQPDERGVVMRLGKYHRTAEPGLHFALWPIERMERPKTGSVRQINIGNESNETSMLTADKNIINVPFSVFWRITDAKSFLYNVADPERVIRNISQSAMREVVGQTKAQPLLTTGKDVVAAQVMEITQKLLNDYSAGVTVTAVNLGDVQPPAEVANAFAEVVRAGQNQQQLINEAEQYKNQRGRLAEGEAAKMIEDANGYKASVVADAQGQAARFLSVYEQYKNAKDVTRERLFLEMMEQVMANTNKIVIEGGQGGSGVVPYLPLPEVKNRASGTQN
jgi:modulator of FtsH protease HflK